MRVAAPASTERRNYPTNEIEQTAAVMAVLMSATQPLNAGAIAATFKQSRKATLKKVEAVLAALNNTGFLDTRDGGRTFLLRRVA